MTNSQLLAMVEQLQAENEQLRSEVRNAETLPLPDLDGGGSPTTALPPRSRRGRGRTVAAVALVVIGLLLVPLAVMGSWAKDQLADTDTFVATFAPLAQDPAVKAFVVSEVMTVISDQVDFEGTTSEVFDAVGELGLPPAATTALQALKRPAALGLQSLATSVVTNFVDSAAFEDIWAQALRLSHQQLVAAMTGDPGAAIAISGSGELSVQLGPILDAVKSALDSQGFGFADAIPSVDISIAVAQSDGIGQLTLIYALAVGIGSWLPWIALAFLVAGVAVAKRRSVALFWTGLTLGVVMVLLGIALRIGNIVTVASIAPRYVPIDAAGVIYDAVISLIASTVVALAVLAFTVMVISWAVGPYRPAPAIRAAFAEGTARLRRIGDDRGISTGRFGVRLGRYRIIVQILVGVAAAALILFVRPLSTGQIVWTAVVAVVILLLVELLKRPAPIEVIEVIEPEAIGSSDSDALVR